MIYWRGPRGRQEGQALVLIAVMLIGLTAAVGLAIDAGIGYSWNTQAERAASSAALSGVVLMPDQFDSSGAIPPGSANDATDRAVEEAALNGFDVNDTADHVQVTPLAIDGHPNELQVTVCRDVKTSFMQLFGVGTYTVCRTATATYLPPLTIGGPGNQLGVTVSQLGVSGYYFIRTMGYASDRGDGDAFTPQLVTDQGINYNPPSTDMHAIAAANNPSTDVSDPSLPSRGGYNLEVYLPQGGIINVYNAGFAPAIGALQDYCENSLVVGVRGPCNPLGGPYYLHEDDSFGSNTLAHYSAMRYTLFQVNNKFNRLEDTMLTQLTVMPVDATQARGNTPRYKDVNTGVTINQAYDGDGNPTNMQIYHSWIDVANADVVAAGDGDGVTDPGLVQYSNGLGPYGGPLPAGTYRLRIDTLEHDASLAPPDGAGNQATAHKAIAVSVTDQAGVDCTTEVPACTLGGWGDLAIYTPVRVGLWTLPFLNIPPDYAGQPISLQFFDVGDSTGNVTLTILDPTTGYQPFQSVSPKTVRITNLGVDRTTDPPGVNSLISNNNTASVQTTVNNNRIYDGDWIQMTLPIPDTYTPGANPWWQLQYQTTGGAFDTFTIAASFKGNPAHVVRS